MNRCGTLPAASLRALAAAALLLFASTSCTENNVSPQTLRIGNHAEPATLDPHRSEGVPARNIQRDLFEGLVTADAAGLPVGGVAQTWETSDDGMRWTFHLRPDARWSNGDPVTAADFVFSLQRAVQPETSGIVSETLLPLRNAAAILAGTADPATLGAAAPDANTLVIELETPTPYLPGIFMHPSTFPVHKATVNNDSWTSPGGLISNGAYQLAEWRVHSHIALERSPHYHDAQNVAIARVEYLPIEDERAELARFEAGDIHITYAVPPGRLAWLRENYAESLQVHPWFGVYYLGLNTTREPLRDPRVRRALSLVLDRDLLASVAGSGETPAYNWIPPVAGYLPQRPEWASWPYQQRVALARELLHDAGYRDRPLQLELLYSTRDRDKRVVTAVDSMWRRQLGVETKLINQEWKVYLQTRKRLDATQVFRSGWIGEYADPNTFAEILHSQHAMNEFGWRNADYDAQLEAAARSIDNVERFAWFMRAEQQIQQDVPLIPLFHYAKARLVSTQLAGYTPNLMDHHYSKHYSWQSVD